MQPYYHGAPLDRVQIDVLGPFPVSESGNRYILVIIDQFTKWVESFAIPRQNSATTAKTLVNEFIARYGAPLELHTDQGSNFQSELFRNVCKLLDIAQTRTTPYHPASNGQVERFNRTILQMIRCYVDKGQRLWDEHLPLLLAAYRSTPHASTKCTPNRLMLGREVHLPHDLLFRDVDAIRQDMPLSTYMDRLKEDQEVAHNLAREHLHDAQRRQKKLYNMRVLQNLYTVGDLVYISDQSRTKGKSPKLQEHLEGSIRGYSNIGTSSVQNRKQQEVASCSP